MPAEKKVKISSKVEYKKDERFVNPYNFVPLLGRCERSGENREEEKYTGYFECEMELLSPLFIPNTSCDTALCDEIEAAAKCKGYDFFSYMDLSSNANSNSFPDSPENPVIPGSEIRGPVRSVHEAAFNGCMSTVSLDRVLERRTTEPKKPGIIKKEGNDWILIPCQRARLWVDNNEKKWDKTRKASLKADVIVSKEEYDGWEEGKEIWFQLKQSKGKGVQSKKKEMIQGWVHKGEYFANKRYESIFYGADNARSRKLKEEDVNRLQNILQEYRDSKRNRALKEDENWYKKYFINEKGTLVYYAQERDRFYLSPACIGKEIFFKKVRTLLENKGGYQPCTGEEGLCPSCRIFGIMDKGIGKRYSVGSKVRFTDAVLSKKPPLAEKLYHGFVRLPELGEPKIGAAEFYTFSPYKNLPKSGWNNSEGYWTYDYRNEKRGGIIERCRLNDNLPELRGRKFYWHSDVTIELIDKKLKNVMQQRIRPLKESDRKNGSGIFLFKVYFEDLLKTELSQLRWALDFDDPSCAHKIGRAKPLGFGSARIHIKDMELRVIDRKTGTWKLEKRKPEEFLEKIDCEQNEAIKALKLIASWENKPKNVNYPQGKNNKSNSLENSNASHQWFTINREMSVDTKNGYQTFFKVLPTIEQEADPKLDSAAALYKVIRVEKS